MGSGSMVHLTSVHDPFHARVIAARLGSDGILTELRGNLAGPYPIPGEVQVYVDRDDLAVARELLLADEVEWCFHGSVEEDAPLPRAPSAVRWVAVVAVVLVAALWLGRAL